MIRFGDSIAILGCSDGNKHKYFDKVNNAVEAFKKLGLFPVVYESAFADKDDLTVTGEVRARNLVDAFCDENIKAIFDVTGGDACKEILPFMDWDLVRKNVKPFFGYSDNSVIMNPLKQKCNVPCFYFQGKFVGEDEKTFRRFSEFLECGSTDCELFKFDYSFLQGNGLKGKEIVGGNIRCTLKLFDTDCKPDFSDRILFLESLGGELKRIEEFFVRLKEDGVFEKCSSVLLGNFSVVNHEGKMKELYKMVLKVIGNENLPVAYTTELGHETSAKCLSYQMKFE